METPSDLRSLVLRHAGMGRRVALLSSDAALVEGLEGAGCTVLADPPSLEAVTDFRPEVVVAFDGLLAEGFDAFSVLARAAPGAQLVFSFANAASAALLSRALQGEASARAFAEKEVREALTSAGYVVDAREVVVTPWEKTSLAAGTDAALRQLFEQLNPDAVAHRFLVVAHRGVEATPPDRTSGVVTVVVCAGDDLGALTGTLGSLVGQLHRALEAVVVSRFSEEAVLSAGAGLKARAGASLRAVQLDSSDEAAQCNAGLAQARGQYVAFLSAGELLDARHFSSLVERLEAGTEAWATATPAVEPPLPFDAGAWGRAGAAHRGLWLFDRNRLGSFRLTFPEDTRQADLVLFLRLNALFPPAFKVGLPTLDSPYAASTDVGAVLEAFSGRPLQALVAQARLLRPPPAPSVQGAVQHALEVRSPWAARAFSRTVSVVQHVREAAVQAREQARSELGGEDASVAEVGGAPAVLVEAAPPPLPVEAPVESAPVRLPIIG